MFAVGHLATKFFEFRSLRPCPLFRAQGVSSEKMSAQQIPAGLGTVLFALESRVWTVSCAFL